MSIRYSTLIKAFIVFLCVFVKPLIAQNCPVDQPSQELLRRARADSSNPTAWYNLGCAYANEGQNRFAIDALKNAITLNEKFIEAYFLLGSLRVKDRLRLDEGIQDLERVVELDPNHQKAWTLLGTIYYKHQNFSSSKPCLLRAKNLGFAPQVDYYLGRLFYFSNQYESALKHLEDAINTGADSTFLAYITLGDIQIKQFRFEDAITKYDLAIKRNPASQSASKKLEQARNLNKLYNDFKVAINQSGFEKAKSIAAEMGTQLKNAIAIQKMEKAIECHRHIRAGDDALLNKKLTIAVDEFAAAIFFAEDTTERRILVNKITAIKDWSARPSSVSETPDDASEIKDYKRQIEDKEKEINALKQENRGLAQNKTALTNQIKQLQAAHLASNPEIVNVRPLNKIAFYILATVILLFALIELSTHFFRKEK